MKRGRSATGRPAAAPMAVNLASSPEATPVDRLVDRIDVSSAFTPPAGMSPTDRFTSAMAVSRSIASFTALCMAS